jgi:two-component system, NtrC family, response regulator HydG
MLPRLLAIAGPVKGRVLELTGEEVVIGRDPSNQFVLNDRSASRRHAAIRCTTEGFKIVDLGSHNGTIVNDVRREEHLLKQADRIQLGNSHFLFLQANDLLPVQDIELDSAVVTISRVQVNLQDALYSLARDLGALIDLSSRINSARSLTELQRLLLEGIFEVIPAQRGAILLFEDGVEEPHSVFALNRLADQPSITVSNEVMRQVFTEGVSVMSNEILETADVESKNHPRPTSLLCVPLQLFNKTIGGIYLDSTEAGASFKESELKLLTVIAGFVAGSIANVQYMEWLESERERLQSTIEIEHSMIGKSAPMEQVYQFIAKVAPADSTVLIRGESGTGKELVARAIHQNGWRAKGPFIAVNCAALTETLLESELFGHEKGAFTGAVAQKKGKFELADGGTIFLDEVGELTLPIQAKILRVLQEREFEHVGGTRSIKANVRVIAATNRALDKSVADGAFRQDLYYRLNVISLEMPALRARIEDVPLLAKHFIAKYSTKCKRHVSGLSTEARACLINYSWPGNVRELENAIERAVVLGSTSQIQLEDLPDSLLDSTHAEESALPRYYQGVRNAKAKLLRDALATTNNNVSEAARMLGIHPNNLHRLLRNLGVRQ